MRETAVVTAGRTHRTHTDAELVELVRAGCNDAFAELYRRYRPRVGVFVRRLVRDDGRAEDLTQDAFVAALRRMRETDCEILFRPWIYEIARNAAIDLHRRAGRSNEVSLDSRPGLRASDLLRYDAASPGPDAVVLGRERFENLRGALDELPEAHNRIIVLRELEGLSYREIGERMGLSPAAVESTLFRARRKLADEYDDIGTGRRCRTIGVVIARVAQGSASDRDRTRVARHARRCTPCRRRAAALGIAPAPSRAARVAAFLPVFGLGPGASGLVAQGTSVIAATAVVAGGGAVIVGAGPLAPHHHSGGPHRVVARTAAPSSRKARVGSRPAPATRSPEQTQNDPVRQKSLGPDVRLPGSRWVSDPSTPGPAPPASGPTDPERGPSGPGLPVPPGVSGPQVDVPALPNISALPNLPVLPRPEVKLPERVPDIPSPPGLDRLPAVGAAADGAGSLLH
jgi:RNA polymerase sigma factor (sigma-70 family)